MPIQISDRNLSYARMTKERGLLLNQSAGQTLSRVLERYSALIDHSCIVAVGSDGRLEKGHFSPLEVSIYHRGSVDLGPLLTAVQPLVATNGKSLLKEMQPETKNVSTDRMCVAYDDPMRVYPSRLFDGYVLFGSADLFTEAKNRLVAECVAGAISSFITTRKKISKKTMNTGKQMWKGNEILHYDLATGVAYFRNTDEGIQIRSFKAGPLRYVQASVEQAIVASIRGLARRAGVAAATEFALNLPTPTVEKLTFLFDLKHLRLTPSSLSEVVDCYLSFLQLYHLSEERYRANIYSISFNSTEASERIMILARLLGGTTHIFAGE